MPTSLYSPLLTSTSANNHLVMARLCRFHEDVQGGAEEVMWGTGSPICEYWHVDYMAEHSLFVLNLYAVADQTNMQPLLLHISGATGTDSTIRELAEVNANKGQQLFDMFKPDFMAHKLRDLSRLTGMGWRARIGPSGGLHKPYQRYLDHHAEVRG